MKRFFLSALLALCLTGFGVQGAEVPRKGTDANLFGHVVDRATHEHIPYATVSVVGAPLGTTSGGAGP